METEEEVKKLEENLKQVEFKPVESPLSKKIFKDKDGNKLDFKEYMARWKKGIEGLTPLQKAKSQIIGTKISILGLFLGLIVSLIGYKSLWWVSIILVGALINTAVQYISQKQQLEIYQNIENQINNMEVKDGFR